MESTKEVKTGDVLVFDKPANPRFIKKTGWFDKMRDDEIGAEWVGSNVTVARVSASWVYVWIETKHGLIQIADKPKAFIV